MTDSKLLLTKQIFLLSILMQSDVLSRFLFGWGVRGVGGGVGRVGMEELETIYKKTRQIHMPKIAYKC